MLKNGMLEGAKAIPIGEAFKDQPSQIAAAIDRARIERAPDINNVEPSALGQVQINGLAAKDQLRRDAISAAYKDLADLKWRHFPN
jgi:hypothetical protein